MFGIFQTAADSFFDDNDNNMQILQYFKALTDSYTTLKCLYIERKICKSLLKVVQDRQIGKCLIRKKKEFPLSILYMI